MRLMLLNGVLPGGVAHRPDGWDAGGGLSYMAPLSHQTVFLHECHIALIQLGLELKRPCFPLNSKQPSHAGLARLERK